MIQSNTPVTIPDRVEVKLRDVRRARDRTQLIQAVLLGLCVLFITMSAAMLIDWSFTIFDTFWRSVLTVSSLAAAVMTAAASIVISLSRRRALAEVATDVDRSVPRTEERWSTVAELAAAPLEEQRRIHTGMLNRLSSEAAGLDPQVVPEEVVSRRGLHWCAAGLGGIALLILLAGVMDWRQTAVLVQRFWAPTADISVTQLTVPDSQSVAARGEPLVVQATMQGRLVPEATLLLGRVGEDDAQQIAVSPSGQPASQLVHRVRTAEDDLRYRFRAGDGQTDWNEITVVDRPEIAGVRFRATPPDWTNADPVTFNELPEKVAVVEGSVLEVDVLPRDTVDQVTFQVDDSDVRPLTTQDGRWYQYQATLEDDVTLRAVLTESHGLQNRHPPICRIRVFADQAPSVSIVSPTAEMAARPDDVIEIELTATDDFGISKAELVIYDEDAAGGDPQETMVIDIPLNDQQNATEVNTSVPLDLAQLGAEDGKVLSYAVRVYDNHQSTTTAAAAESATNPLPVTSPDGRQMANTRPPSSASSNSQPSASGNRDSNSAASGAPNGGQAAQGAPSPAEAGPSRPNPAGNTQVAAREPSATSPESPSARQNSQSSRAAPSQSTAPSTASPSEAADSSVAQQPQGSSTTSAGSDPSNSTSTASSNSSSRSSSSSEPSENRNQITGASSPPVNRQPSALESAQSASSGMMKLNIDKWSGSFASQQRRRVEMMLAPALRKLDEHLKTAEDRLRESLDALDVNVDWSGPQDRLLLTADQRLKQALRLIITVREKSAETPYAFIGLQLSEIAETHLLPAQDALRTGRKANRNEDRQPPLTSAWQQISRARQRLEELTGSFDRIRREHALADAVEQVRNMYMVFVDGSFEIMSRQQDRINNYQRKIAQFEVDEEYLERLREVLEMRQKLIAEFARILSEDPRLLRRFVDSMNSQSETLRDQLTLLTDRQQAVGAQVRSWQNLEPQLRAAAMAGLIRNKLRESREIARDAARLQEDFDTWSPLTPNARQGDLNSARAELAKIAAAARDVEDSAAAWQVPESDTADGDTPAIKPELPTLDDVIQRSQQLAENLQKLDARLMELSVGQNAATAGPFYVRRVADVRRLMSRLAAWKYQLEQLDRGQFHVSTSVDQHDIALKTNTLTAGLANLEQRIAGVLQRADGTLPADIAEISRQLLKTLDDNVAPSQLGAVFSLRKNDLAAAVTRAEQAAESMLEAEQLFDQLIQRTIEEADKLPVQDPVAALLDDPTLDELLALLEFETVDDLAAALGIPPRPSNLQAMGGFMANRPPDGGVITMSALNGPLQSLSGAGRRAVNRAQEEINSVSLRNKRQLDDWNVLASQLEDRLRQGQDQLPPEQYRRAIEQYFEELSRRSADGQEPRP